MSWSNLLSVPKALKTVIDKVYHFDAGKAKAPYIVWGEEGETNSMYADNTLAARTLSGTVDYFTNNSEDYQMLDRIEKALVEANVSTSFLLCRYEDDTKLCHYEWSFEVG